MSSKKRRRDKRKQAQKSKALLEDKNVEISDAPIDENEEEGLIENNSYESKSNKPKRIPVSKKIRFEVFKRDKFICQYCGRSAPDVVLNVDHIKPVAEDGTNDILNLITSCFDCNSGKRDKLLSDDTVIKKQQAQLEALQERKEQIEMMFEWKKGLLEIDDQITNQLAEYWSELVTGYSLNDNGKAKLKELSRKYQLDEIMTAMKISSEQYLIIENGNYKQESVENAWKKIGGICYNRKLERDNPNLARLYYIRKIMQKNFRYVDDINAMNLLKKAHKLGATLESLEDHVRSSRNWSDWQEGIEEYINKNTEDW